MGHTTTDRPGSWRALDDLVTDVLAKRAAIAELQAQEAVLLAAAGDLVRERTAERQAADRRADSDLPLREVTAELGAAMRLSDRTVQARMSAAATLTMSFPATLDRFRAGRVDAAHVSAIIDAGASLSDPRLRAEYERITLDAAEFETPARLRSIARVVAARLDPSMLEELQRRARADRRVRVIDLDDGMARLLADLPAALAHAIHDRLTQMAHEVRGEAGEDVASEETLRAATDEADGEPDQRTMDELRADILADLLLTGAPTGHGSGDALGAIRAQVQITVPVLTAAGLGDEPALLAGYGPIDRATACRLAAGASGWDRVMYHPHTGAPLAVDRYTPSAELRRFLRVRDERCRFPGCTQRPWRCDIDHTVDAALGGPTSESNLSHFCRRHHTLKHATVWTVQQLGGGILEWKSPTGRSHLDRPPSIVQFVPSPGFGSPGDLDPAPF